MGAAVWAETPSPWEDLKTFPGQPSDIVTPSCPGSSSWSPPAGHVRHTSRGRRPRGIRYRCPCCLSWLLSMWGSRFYSELLPGDGTPHPIAKGAPRHPAKETHFGLLYSWPCGFTCFSTWQTDTAKALLRPPVNRALILPSLMNNTPRYLNSSTWGRSSPPTQWEQVTSFRLRAMALDLEVLILIPAASHSKLPQGMLEVLAWRSQQDNIICEKQRWNPVLPKPEPLRPLAAPRNSVH